MKVVFDFGGVLFNWRPAELLKRALPRQAIDDASAQQWALHFFESYQGDWAHFDRGTVEVPELIERIATRTGLAPDDVRAVVDQVVHELQPMADTVALLRRLRDTGTPLYYLSNMPAPYALHLETEHEVVSWFTDGIFSSRVKAIKPDREIFTLAAERFGGRPEELLFFDDHLPNVLAARAAGWQAVHFTGADVAEAALLERGLLRRQS